MTKKSAYSIPGVYLITNVVTGRVYIGQAINIRRRWESHRHYLAAGKHRNGYLQRAWLKYGAHAFEFSIHLDLSAVPKTELGTQLNLAEVETMDAYPKNYNLMEAGFSAPIAGPETRALWSAQRKALWADPAFRQKRSEETKALYQNVEWKAARDAAVREALQDPARKKRASDRFTKMWENPTHKQTQSNRRKANWNDPNYRAQQSTSRAATWTDPEVRARRSAGIKAAHARRRALKATVAPQDAEAPSSDEAPRTAPSRGFRHRASVLPPQTAS